MTAPLHGVAAPDDDSFVRAAVSGLRPPEHHHDFWDVLGAELDLDAGLASPTASAPQIEAAPRPEPPTPEPKAESPAQPNGQRSPAVASRVALGGRTADGNEHIEWDPAASPIERRRPPRPASPPARRRPLRVPDRREPASGTVPPARSDARPAAPEPAAPKAWAPPRLGEDRPAPARRMGRPERRAAPPDRPRHVAAVQKADEREVNVLPDGMRRRSNALLVLFGAAAAIVAVLAGLTLVRQATDDPAETPSETQPVGGADQADDLTGALPTG